MGNQVAFLFGQFIGLVMLTSPVWGAILVTILVMKRKKNNKG